MEPLADQNSASASAEETGQETPASSVPLENPEEETPKFDQDLVEAFLEMEDVLELVVWINSDLDKARYKEIGYVLFQAFKQRKEYPDVKLLFKTENEDPLDFNEAARIVTDLCLTTGNFKRMSKFVRTQLLYGLKLVKKNCEDPSLNEEMRAYVDSCWMRLKGDCLRQFSEVIGLELTQDDVINLIKQYEKENNHLEAMDMINEYEVYDTDIDWEKGLKTLIDTEQQDKILSVLEHKNEYIRFVIDSMSNNKLCQSASKLLDKMDLDIKDFPKLQERLDKKTVRYYVYCYVKGPSGKDFKPLWKVEDLFSGYDQMLAYICEELAFQKKEKFQKNAKALALRNGVFELMRQDVQKKLDGVQISESDMNIDCIEDHFGPISEPHKDYFALPETTKVTFIGSDEEVKLAEPLLHSKHLGVDCEWRPALVKFNKTSVALLQIGDKENVFLIDMKALNESEALDELLSKVFNGENTNIIGMSFHCDLGELARGAPKLKFWKKIANLYDVQPMYGGLYKQKMNLGLSKIVDAVIGQKVCKAEQMGNWEKRPLRKSQMHYGALDAFILVELMERMIKHAEEQDIKIEDYKKSFEYGENGAGKESISASTTFNINKQQKGESNAKTIKLKATQHIAPNSELQKLGKQESYAFCMDYNLARLGKLLRFKEFDVVKTSKQTSALDRVTMCKEKNRIFISKDDKKFNKCTSIPSLLVRKNDPAERMFNEVMRYLDLDISVTKEDVENIKGEEWDDAQ